MYKDKYINRNKKTFLVAAIFILLLYKIILNTKYVDSDNLIGWIDSFTDDKVKGWLCIAGVDPNRIMLEFTIDDAFIGFTQRSFNRIDISARKLIECSGQPYMGFEINYIPKPGRFLNIKIIDLQNIKTYWYTNFMNIEKKYEGNLIGYTNPLNRYRLSFGVKFSDDKVRIHVMMPSFNKDMTGGPLSILRFLVSYCKILNFNLILTTNEGLDPVELRQHMTKYDGFSNLELIGIQRFNEIISVSSNDYCIATIYYTMYTCKLFLDQIKSKTKIIYFVQDYESIFFPGGSNWIEAENSYKIPHFAIYSTNLLYDYFKTRSEFKVLDHFSAKPAIKSRLIGDPSKSKCLFVYARPHSDRNAFEFTMLLLEKLIGDGLIDDSWEIFGVGSLPGVSDVIIKKLRVKMINNIPEPEYFKLLKKGSIAISLMTSPHPSLPPLDFAANGMVTITNSFWTKNVNNLNQISKNIIVSDLNLEALTKTFEVATSLIDDIKQRKENSQLDWPVDWNDNDCYGYPLLNKLKMWMNIDIL